MNFSAIRMLGLPPRIIIQTNEQWIDGYKACLEGKVIGDNPFMTETDESDSWLAGYHRYEDDGPATRFSVLNRIRDEDDHSE